MMSWHDVCDLRLCADYDKYGSTLRDVCGLLLSRPAPKQPAPLHRAVSLMGQWGQQILHNTFAAASNAISADRAPSDAAATASTAPRPRFTHSATVDLAAYDSSSSSSTPIRSALEDLLNQLGDELPSFMLRDVSMRARLRKAAQDKVVLLVLLNVTSQQQYNGIMKHVQLGHDSFIFVTTSAVADTVTTSSGSSSAGISARDMASWAASCNLRLVSCTLKLWRGGG